MTDCAICCDTLNKSTRAPIECSHCQTDDKVCRQCTMSQYTNNHAPMACILCNQVFTDDFIQSAFPKTSYEKIYKPHQLNIEFDREMSLLPSTQPAAMIVKQQRLNQVDASKIQVNITKNKQEREVLYSERWALATPPLKKTNMLAKCQDNGCNGLVTSDRICGVCGKSASEDHIAAASANNVTCPKCSDMVYRPFDNPYAYCNKCSIHIIDGERIDDEPDRFGVYDKTPHLRVDGNPIIIRFIRNMNKIGISHMDIQRIFPMKYDEHLHSTTLKMQNKFGINAYITRLVGHIWDNISEIKRFLYRDYENKFDMNRRGGGAVNIEPTELYTHLTGDQKRQTHRIRQTITYKGLSKYVQDNFIKKQKQRSNTAIMLGYGTVAMMILAKFVDLDTKLVPQSATDDEVSPEASAIFAELKGLRDFTNHMINATKSEFMHDLDMNEIRSDFVWPYDHRVSYVTMHPLLL